MYDAVRTVDYPRYSDGTLAAAVHPQVQGRDFRAVRAGDPVFLTMEGETVGFAPKEGEPDECYPFLVNEAAYYEKGIAFMIAHRAAQPVMELKEVGNAETGRVQDVCKVATDLKRKADSEVLSCC